LLVIVDNVDSERRNYSKKSSPFRGNCFYCDQVLKAKFSQVILNKMFYISTHSHLCKVILILGNLCLHLGSFPWGPWSLGSCQNSCQAELWTHIGGTEQLHLSVKTDAFPTSILIHILHSPSACLGCWGCLALPGLSWHIHGMLYVWKIIYNNLLTSTS
jgi:hypothetical protein